MSKPFRGRVRLNIINDVKHMSSSSRVRSHEDPAALTLGDFEQLVLLALFRLGPDAYGATIRREIEQRTGRDLAMSAVYVTIDRLETKGFVLTRIGEPTPERGGRRRRHVTLLPLGRRALTVAFRRFKAMTDGLEQQLNAR